MNFMETFCQKGWKMDAFNLKGAQNFKFQLVSGLLIIIEFYLAILAAVDSNIGNLFSTVVALCIFFNMMTYFGFSSRSMNALSSDAAMWVMAGISFFYLMASVSNDNGVSHFGYSFLLMT